MREGERTERGFSYTILRPFLLQCPGALPASSPNGRLGPEARAPSDLGIPSTWEA